jgi:SPP1 gp7 family putative phage head morphogenesis protein
MKNRLVTNRKSRAGKIKVGTSLRTLRIDPTRTGMLRRDFLRQVSQRFKVLRGNIIKFVADQDAFGLRDIKPFVTANADHAYASTHVLITDPVLLAAIKQVQSQIDPKDVVKIEDEPHVTVRYGLHPEPGLGAKVQKIIDGVGPIALEVGGLSLFQKPEFDVLKCDVEGSKLRLLNGLLKQLPHTDTYPTYSPHLTIAYLQPGTGAKYLELQRWIPVGYRVRSTEVTYAGTDGAGVVLSTNQYSPDEPRDTDGKWTAGGGGGSPGIKGHLNDLWNRLPKSVQRSASVTTGLVKAGMYAGDITHRTGRVLARMAAEERGLSPEHAKRVEKIVDIIDTIGTLPGGKVYGRVGQKAISAATGGLIGGKIPFAALSYLAYSTVKNPAATMRAAKRLVKETVQDLKIRGVKAAFSANAAVEDSWIPDLVDRLKTGDEWYIALLSAALDETGADVVQSMKIADRVYLTGNPPAGEDTDEDLAGFTTNSDFKFKSDPEKVKAFQNWLKQQYQSIIKGKTEEELWRKYIADGFAKGAKRSFDDAKKTEKAVATWGNDLDFYNGTKEQFLKDTFMKPETIDKVKLLAGRAFDELEGVTADMSLKMSRALTDGLVQGKNPLEIARDLNKVVDIGENRAKVIARTEIIRAHAEGQLTSLEALGVEDLGVAVEWSTAAGDTHDYDTFGVCELCQPLDGIVVKIDEAKGMLPRHPQCRCAWIPANVGEDSDAQKTTKGAIGRAIGKSVKEDKGEDNGAWGPGATISKVRPQSVLTNLLLNALREHDRTVVNAFCPTGEGGGVDPTCGGGGSQETRFAGKVRIDSDDESNLKQRFGWTPTDVARLAGALPGASVEVISVRRDSVTVRVDSQEYSARRVLWKDHVENDSLYATTPGKGVGTKVFTEQVSTAVEQGLSHIETIATRGEGPGGENGHYTWARLGYDAHVNTLVSMKVKADIQEKFPGTTRISDLMKTTEGRSWWKQNGITFKGKFDLKEGSLSRKVLDEYAKARESSRATTNSYPGGGTNSGRNLGQSISNAFCPTGEGGGQDNSCSPGKGSAGPHVQAALASVLKHTGYTAEQLKTGLASNPTIRARVAGSILLGKTGVKDAVTHLPDNDHVALAGKIKGMTKGDATNSIKELSTVPEYDLGILTGIEAKPTNIPGEALARMLDRSIVVGPNTRPGSYRHELGHVLRAALGGDSFKGQTAMTKAIFAEYDQVMGKVKANPAGLKQKQEHEWYEKEYGVAGRRSLDNAEENFAEHYRIYHKALHQDKHEGGNGTKLAGYRERHPGMAKIFDAHYTAALIHKELTRGS